MSAFQVSISPMAVKRKPPRNENREPVPVIMAPFSAKATVVFESVPVTKTARRILVVTNPTDDELKVTLTKGFKSDLNISVDWESGQIPPQGNMEMELVWNPMKVFANSETIQFTDNRNFRKDVNVILKSIKPPGPKSGVGRFPSLSSGVPKQTTKIVKAVSSHTISMPNKTKTEPLTKISKSDMNIARSIIQTDHKTHNHHILEKKHVIESCPSPQSQRRNVEKENVSPETPKNACDLFDKFKFTPATETKPKQSSNLEILSSMPTPVLGNQKHEKKYTEKDEGISCGIHPRRLVDNMAADSADRTPRRSATRTSPRWTPKIVRHSCTNASPSEKKEITSNKFEPRTPSVSIKRTTSERAGSVSPLNGTDGRRNLFRSDNISPLPTNKTFEMSSKSTESMDSGEGSYDEVHTSTTEIVMDKTTTVVTSQTRILSIIMEEEKSINAKHQILDETNGGQVTFNMPDENLLRDIELVGTPLRKASASMKDLSSKKPKIASQGSMPNLSEMGTIESIEQNRYFIQIKQEEEACLDELNISMDSMKSVSTQEIHFDQHEFLAQSSRFNVNEASHKKMKMNPSTNAAFRTPSKSLSTAQPRETKRLREYSFDLPTSSNNLLTPDICCQDTYYMAVSPPKRTRLDLPKERPGTKVRVNKWSVTQPKKLKLIKPVVKKSVTPRKIKTEPRVMLYDSNIYLQTLIGPDPFAATVTFDPFLTATVYLDDGAVKRHEDQLKKWLNALVALPADLDTDCNKKIDVGNLFNAVRDQELILAPTKEEQSMNYLTKARMEALRKAAVTLYMSNEMIEICSKVAVYINKQSIEMRKDRDLHLDVVLQRYILELLLSFNPLWLRLGLEVVFGEVIHLHSNSDIIGLSTFILNRLFRDRFLEQKHPRAYTLSESYANHIKKFTLQKFLFLLLFLDKAKNRRIIKHNPCLFVCNSKYKEMKEILQRFSSELLANVGDITRSLKRLGYVLTHKQTFIDEFNYAFNNLAVDLRDGVRLCRVMEIILLRDDLTGQLRVPAISRTQKQHNARLALTALKETDFELHGDIGPNDIVDGHREKTLSLLWQILYKFRSPKFNAAATIIQHWWRSSWLKVCIKRRIQIKIEKRRNDAATIIQSAFRGYISRKTTKVWRVRKITNVTILQKYVRSFLCRRHYRVTCRKIVTIQHWYRATRVARVVRLEYQQLRTSTIRIQRWYRRVLLSRKLQTASLVIRGIKKQAKLEYDKSVVIQRVWKSIIIHKKLHMIVQRVIQHINSQKLEYRSAARIQSFFQMIKLRRELRLKRKSALKIQNIWRLHKVTQAVRRNYLIKRSATVCIQKYFRGFMAMQNQQRMYQMLRSSAIQVQRRYRANQLAKLERRRFLHLKSNVIVIQQRLRAILLMREQHTKYVRLRKAAKVIQERRRAQLQMRRERGKYLQLKSAAIKIQQKLRATLLARTIRLEFIAIQFNSIIVQQRYRGNQLMKTERAIYLKLKAATICIQQRYRAQKLMQSTKNEFLTQRKASIVLQRRYRALIKMRQQRQLFVSQKHAAIKIQLAFRATQAMRSNRTNYLRLKTATICLQRHYRAKMMMQSQRMEFLRMRRAAIVVQARFRAILSMRKHRSEYLALKTAVTNIQQRFRARQLMQVDRADYIRFQKAVVCIQSRFRSMLAMHMQRSQFLQLKHSALLIQTRLRAHLVMKEQRKCFLALKLAAVTIQRRFRARQSMKIASNQYIVFKTKTIVIQRYIRSYFVMKPIHQLFILQRSSAVHIQQWWRRTILQRHERTTYLKTITATRTIQERWRATVQMRIVRREYLEIRKRTIQIQTFFRAYRNTKHHREKFLQLKNATVILQRRFRARQQMIQCRTDFLVQKCAAIKIQQWFRSVRIMRIVRVYYIRLRQAAIFVQQKHRARILCRAQHEAYQEMKYVTLHLQRHIRGLLARKRFIDSLTPERREEIRRRKAARIIQKFWRGYRIRKLWQNAVIREKRERIKQLKLTSKPSNAIKHKIVTLIMMLKRRYSITELLSILIQLENLSRVVPHTLKVHAAFIASFSYGIMAQANRSEPDKQVIELCGRIILNFARYPATKEDVFQEPGLTTIAQMLLRWSDKDCHIFNTLCTLVYVFIHSEEKKKVIRNFMTTRESAFMVRETKKLVLRKKRMLSHLRKPNPAHQQQFKSTSSNNSRQPLPCLEADFGVAKKSIYIFSCRVFALDTILSILDISV